MNIAVCEMKTGKCLNSGTTSSKSNYWAVFEKNILEAGEYLIEVTVDRRMLQF